MLVGCWASPGSFFMSFADKWAEFAEKRERQTVFFHLSRNIIHSIENMVEYEHRPKWCKL